MNVARGGASTALGLLVAFGCGGSDASPPNQGGGGTVVVDLPDGGTAEVPAPPKSPDVGGEPPDGIYVSNTRGVPGNDGAKTRPVRTIAEGIALGKEKRLPVNVCAEEYAEAVKLVDGVTLFGYFDCTHLEKWVRGTTHAKIISPTSPAVLGENLVLPANFEGFDVEAPSIDGISATGPAASSYGMILRSSQNLTLAELTIRAGKGQDGVDAVEPDPNVELSNNADGKPSSGPIQQLCSGAICNFVAAQGVNAVPGSEFGTSQCKMAPSGGPGGKGGSGCISDGGLLRNCTVGEANGQGGGASTAQGGSATDVVGAGPGANGTPGIDGTTGTHGTWSFSATGFVPGDGIAGSNGAAGKGGGGGAGSMNYGKGQLINGATIIYNAPENGIWRSATGGGGGAGGCGGVAGAAGKGGGASIGLFVVGSDKISIMNSRLEGKKGGRAGKGATGTAGLAGHLGGTVGPKTTPPNSNGTAGAAGGKGGDGGHAGLSGHGSVGPSIALVFTGARPFTKDVTFIAGEPGDGHPQVGLGSQTLPAAVGEAKAEHSF